ncbi:MAG: sugar phosphate isomerase/epimerase [Candidatus Latescibacteria bacterium]|nr:sugar phosphate isomerase/epimerase [Candidatus Latescibacterota bacterium]
MAKKISRREALSTGTVAGMLSLTHGAGSESQMSEKFTPPPFLTPWSPPPNHKRDLTPGKTPIRLASWSSTTTLDYNRDGGISITDMVKRIRDAGYTSGNASIRRSIWFDATDSEVKELQAALAEYDVTFFDMHTTGSNIHPDPEEREKVYRYTIDSCIAAEKTGCPMVTTHTGSAGYERAMSPHKDNWTRDTWKKSVQAMRTILKDTAGMKVALGVEATNMTAMNNPRAHLQLIEEIGDPRLKVCIDPVNMINLGTYFRNTELIGECFDLLGEHIIAAHAKDTYILPNKMSAYITEVAPGKGILDYETYLVRLSRLSYPRTLLIEHIPDEEYPGAKKYIEDTAKKVNANIYH